MNVHTIGVDISKSVFYLHGVDAKGKEVLRKKLYRDEFLEHFVSLKRCRVVMEACAGSNHWAREIAKLGHETKLIAPQYVRPYVKRNKNDWKDAEAIAEASQRPNMRYVPQKSAGQQDIQNLHRIRERMVKHRTALINEARAQLHEYGVVLPKSRQNFEKRYMETLVKESSRLSSLCFDTLSGLWSEYLELKKRIVELERKLKTICREHPECQKLITMPGVGYLTATAMLAAVADVSVFKNGRSLAAWIGLTPREVSTGGKQRLFGISKRGDKYLRKLLVHGARVTLRHLAKYKDQTSVWATNLKQQKGSNKAAVALANKNARVIFALLSKGEVYKQRPLVA